MEHQNELTSISNKTGIEQQSKLKLLYEYSEAIFSENQKFNLTGHKTLSDIIENLIIGSILPLKNIHVPRGTIFADIGTGSGIPGVPISIFFDYIHGFLFDSNHKKISFINKTTTKLGINNINGINLRVEDACRMKEYRGKFDIVFTRAMSDIYTISELSAPLLKKGGTIFLYTDRTINDFNNSLLKHFSELGISTYSENLTENIFINGNYSGLFLVKVRETEDKYPRRISVIKRMASRS